VAAAPIAGMERAVAAAAALLEAAVRAGATRHVAAAVAASLLRCVLGSDCLESADAAEVEDRADLAGAALQAHQCLNALNGWPSHSLGAATEKAGGQITASERRSLRSLRKKANAARHVWPPGPAVGPGPPKKVGTTSASDGTEPGAEDASTAAEEDKKVAEDEAAQAAPEDQRQKQANFDCGEAANWRSRTACRECGGAAPAQVARAAGAAAAGAQPAQGPVAEDEAAQAAPED